MHTIGKVSLLPAREQVASILRQAILLRQFKEGQSLTLKEASDLVGASITPVREAFQILENEGLLKLHLNKGAVVLGVTAKSIHDHYSTRAILEAYAAGQASRIDRDISLIKETFQTSERAICLKDVNLYRDCNMTFHMSIWQAANNKRMEKILSSLWNGFSLGYMITEEEYLSRSWEEHKAIFAAICSHDSTLAEDLMKKHIIRSMEDILTRYTHEGDDAIR
ncbi:MAG: GntR family transcriptional regulator [Caldicoprobacterales bacterium]|jgi:DNA-binding GntR family transcriptional regulator